MTVRELLSETTSAWGLPLSDTQIHQFDVYLRELKAWNAHTNLTAITDDTGIVVRHFLDSLRCALSWGDEPTSLIDIGTGGGFPGLPLKILRPTLALTLVESIEKKTAFLRHVSTLLALDSVVTLAERAEAIGHDPAHRERYDVVVARAVADLRVLTEYTLPLCRVGGRFLAPKGGQAEVEVAAAREAVKTLGGDVPRIEQVLLPDIEPRTLVIIDKIAPTPERYPRNTGIPSKRPL